MGMIKIILLCFFLSEISAYALSKIEGIQNEQIVKVDFDALGTTYVVTRLKRNSHRLYKLDQFNNIYSTLNVPYNVADFLVSKRGIPYFRLDSRNSSTLSVVWADSKTLQPIGEISPTLFVLDNSDNFFFAKEKGIYSILQGKMGSSNPISIMKLETYTAVSSRTFIVDQDGNIYLQVTKKGMYSLVFISQKSISRRKPYATFVHGLENTPDFIQDLALDKTDTLWISIANNNLGAIKKLMHGNLEIVQTDVAENRKKMLMSENGTYVITGNSNGTNTSIYFITLQDKVFEIPELENLSAKFYNIIGLIDREHQAYFYTTFGELSQSQGTIITIKPGEMKPIPVLLRTPQMIRSVKLDINEDLWILQASNIYRLKKGETIPEIPRGLAQACSIYEDIGMNFITGKAYVSCSDEVFAFRIEAI